MLFAVGISEFWARGKCDIVVINKTLWQPHGNELPIYAPRTPAVELPWLVYLECKCYGEWRNEATFCIWLAYTMAVCVPEIERDFFFQAIVLGVAVEL